jgi:hypothetical protein
MNYSRVIAALQTIPGGRFVVGFIRGTTDMKLSFPMNRQIDLPIAGFIRSEVSNFCGFDWTVPENIPEIRTLWEWNDKKASPAESSICSVFAMPMRPGKINDAIHLYDELRGERLDAMDAHLRNQKVSKAETFLQHGHEGHFTRGAFISHCIQSSYPLDHLLSRLATGESDIARYYRKKTYEISGLDWAKKWQLPRTDLLFDWSAKKGIMTSMQRATTTL